MVAELSSAMQELSMWLHPFFRLLLCRCELTLSAESCPMIPGGPLLSISLSPLDLCFRPRWIIVLLYHRIQDQSQIFRLFLIGLKQRKSSRHDPFHRRLSCLLSRVPIRCGVSSSPRCASELHDQLSSVDSMVNDSRTVRRGSIWIFRRTANYAHASARCIEGSELLWSY